MGWIKGIPTPAFLSFRDEFKKDKSIFNSLLDDALDNQLKELRLNLARETKIRKEQEDAAIRYQNKLKRRQEEDNLQDTNDKRKRRKYDFEESENYKAAKKLRERRIEQKLAAQAEVEVSGDKQLEDLRNGIACFPTLTVHQLMFAEVFTQASLPKIYGKDYLANELRIKRENAIEELNQFCLICCPRRFGKTTITAVYVANYLRFIRGANVTVFSPGKRQSSLFMEAIKKALAHLEDCGYVFDRKKGHDNQERFGIVVDGDLRQVTVLPSKESVNQLILITKLTNQTNLTN